MTDSWRWSATQIAAAIASRDISCRQVVEDHLARIEAANPAVNAVTRVLADDALAEADSLDARIAAGESPGPLGGVPITVKENIDLAGSPTTLGVVALKDDLPLGDAPHVAQLRAAGAIPIARTNLPDYALRWHTENELHGLTRNPWDAGLTCGGSSGGDAAALAAGMTPLGLGNDVAGSVRWPSQCCGTVAIKPSRGRVPRTRMVANPAPRSLAFTMFAVHGPMTRTVEDAWLALRHMSGYSMHDPNWVPAPLDGPPVAPPARVGVITTPPGATVHPAISAGIDASAAALSAAGYAVEEVTPPSFERAVELYWQCMGDLTNGANQDLVGPGFARYRDTFAPAYASVLGDPSPDPWAERQMVAQQWSEFMDRYPLLLAPVATRPAFPVGYDEAGESEAHEWLRAIPLVVLVNLFGLPALSLPTSVVDGVPHGVQVIGRIFREDLCVAAARAIENAIGGTSGPFTPIEPVNSPSPA